MVILSVNGVGMSFGEDELFRGVTFDIQNDDKVGLVGVNGSGKTTLFRIINKEYTADDGTVSKSASASIGYMEQHVIRDSDVSLYNETVKIFGGLMKIEQELDEIHSLIDSGKHDDKLLERQALLTQEYENRGGLTYRARTASTLVGLGFSKDELDKPLNVLSGGQKSKVQLAKLLLSEANLLLLDEPTNHLDIASVEWLEKFLLEYRGAYIVISHDRYFLDKVTNKTLELENMRTTMYKGGYSEYLRKKEEDRVILQKHYDEQIAEIKRIEDMIALQKHFGQERNYITIAHKQHSIDRIKSELIKPESAPKAIHFNFSCEEAIANDILMADKLSMSFDGKQLFKNINLDIKKNQRVFLLGANGCGKTTLFKILTKQLTAESGKFNYGAHIEAGYFDQLHSGLDFSKDVLNEVWDTYPGMKQTEVRTALGSFLFRGDEVFKPIKALSGGERARVALLKLMLSRKNMLLLDEPTNHLDINSREALETALDGYNGTLFIISHDRYLINKLADKIYYMTSDGITEFNGNYDVFVEQQSPQINAVKEKPEKKVNSYNLKKERESEMRKLKTKVKRCEEQIEKNEQEIAALNQQLSQPEISSDYEKTLEITNRISLLSEENDKAMSEWAEASEKLDEYII